jgi:signal transduction histidine kinase
MADGAPCIEVGRAVRRDPPGAAAAAAAAEEARAALRVHPPSAALVFASVRHDLPDVLRGVRRVLGDVPIIGSTTAGEICDGIHHQSVVVTVLASPHLSVSVGVGADVARDWAGAVATATEAPGVRDFFGPSPTAWQRLAGEARSAFAFVLSPGATQRAETKGFPIIEQLKRRSLGRLPIFGMSASDEMKFEQNYVLAGDRVVPDGLLVAVFETQLRFGIAIAHGFQPVGRSALVTAAEENEVVQLDGRPAADVYAELVDVPRASLDGVFVARATRTLIGIPGALGSYIPNAATYVTPRGGLRFAIPVPPGQTVSRIVVRPDTATTAGPEAVAKAAARGGVTRPALAVACSCAIRPLLVGERYPQEMPSMVAALQGAPLVGMVSCGEAGPADDGVSQHMNAVIGALVLGDELSPAAQVARENEELRRRTEAIHQQSREELERLVGERTVQLEGANAQLRAEIEERRRLQRAWRTLSECNAAVAQAGDEGALLREVCRILVEVGGYRMSWVGLTGADGALTPAAVAGHDDGYVAQLGECLAAAPGAAPGEAAQASRSGLPVVVRNLRTAPEFAAHRDAAAQRGFTSMVALPLTSAAGVFGHLFIYGSEANALDAGEIALLSDLAGNLALGVSALRDRVERARIAARLVEADRLVSMGTLAAGVAHEINNPLSYASSGMNALTELLGDDLTPQERRQEALGVAREVRQGLERIRQAVQDLKLFSRGGDEALRPVDVQAVLESTLRLANNDLRHRARLVRAYGPTPPVLASEAKLGQVFLNLVVHACRSLPDGAVDRNELRAVTYTDPRGWAAVELHDTGPGLTGEVRARIFDPFAVAQAGEAGLSLAVCKSVVTAMGGEIAAESRPGEGNLFRVAFPPLPADDEDEAPGAAPGLVPGPRRARVLVLDDEPLVARSIVRMLARAHEVTAETSSAAALARIRAGEVFDVILCDVMMPQLSGPDFHAELARTHPALARRVAFITGGAFTPGAAQYLTASGSRVLEKPFEAEAVLELVRELA